MSEGKTRRDFMKSALVGATAARFLARGAKSAEAEDTSESLSGPRRYLEPFNYAGVRLMDGMLRKQYLATREYFYNLPEDDILKGFRKRAGLPAPGNAAGAWGAEDLGPVFGQFLSGMARMYKVTGDRALLAKAVRLMREWVKTFDADGAPYYASSAKELALSHYSWDKTVCGLVDLYQFGGENDALPVLERMTDWGVKHLDRSRKPPGGYDTQGFPVEWYTLSENLYRAYQFTGDSKYKDFGDFWHYDHYWGMFTGKVPLEVRGYHAYSHVNTLSSAAMTYAVTGKPEYLKTIVNAYEHFQKVQCYATGGYGPTERLVAADGSLGRSLEEENNTFETPCGSWSIFKLGSYLMQFTGEARYGDWIEKLVYNGIGAALPMAPEGKTFYYSDYRLGPPEPLASARKVYYWDPYPCCSGTYIQAVADYHNIIYFKDDRGLYVNLFVPSEARWIQSGTDIEVTQETSYPESDTISLTVQAAHSAAFEIRLRVPGWSEGASVQINDGIADIPCQPGTWTTIKRTWRSGDRVSIQFPMRLRLAPIDPQHPNRSALMYGPVVLVQDGRYTRQPNLNGNGSDLAKKTIRTDKPLEFKVVDDLPPSPFMPSTGAIMPFYRIAAGVPYRMYLDLAA
jgi:hypothetical protein